VIFIVGVECAGKTTSIGKLATGFAGGDAASCSAPRTVRAAAVEQLDAGRSVGSRFQTEIRADPAAVVYDALPRPSAFSGVVIAIRPGACIPIEPHAAAEK